VSCIESLLGPVCYEIEAELKPALANFLKGMIVRGYLPQTWVFETENEANTLTVDTSGNAAVFSGAAGPRDVTINWSHDFLSTVLRTRSQASVPYGQHPRITCHTQKGQTAFNFLKKRFGF
jgi:hypothetical protein